MDNDQLIKLLREQVENKITTEKDEQEWVEIEKHLKTSSLDDMFIKFCLERAVERDIATKKIQTLFEYSDNKSNPDLYKWACAFSGLETVIYLEENMTYKSIPSAVTAAICHYRKDTLAYMINKGHNVLTEAHFCMAIYRAGQKKTTFVLDVFKENIDKIKDLSDYAAECVADSWMVESDQATHTKQYAHNLIALIKSTVLNNHLNNQLENKSINNKNKVKL
jgi:hypothetical protein